MRAVGVLFLGVGAGLSILNWFVMLSCHQAYGVWDPAFTLLLELPAVASIGAGAWLIRQRPKSFD
jgi:hypothetical protein